MLSIRTSVHLGHLVGINDWCNSSETAYNTDSSPDNSLVPDAPVEQEFAIALSNNNVKMAYSAICAAFLNIRS